MDTTKLDLSALCEIATDVIMKAKADTIRKFVNNTNFSDYELVHTIQSYLLHQTSQEQADRLIKARRRTE